MPPAIVEPVLEPSEATVSVKSATIWENAGECRRGDGVSGVDGRDGVGAGVDEAGGDADGAVDERSGADGGAAVKEADGAGGRWAGGDRVRIAVRMVGLSRKNGVDRARERDGDEVEDGLRDGRRGRGLVVGVAGVDGGAACRCRGRWEAGDQRCDAAVDRCRADG